MNLATRDDLLNRLARIGKAGPLPKNLDPSTAGLIDQMQRQIGELKEALRATVTSHFEGPQHSRDAWVFSIDARTAGDGYNVLSSAQAVNAGLPADTGYVIYRHASGLLLDGCSKTRWALSSPASPLVNAGGFRIHSYDNQRTVLQLDDAAVTQEVVATLSFFPSRPVPVNFTARPSGSVPAVGKGGQVYVAGDVSPLELP